MAKTIGIDLGTTNSVVAVMEGGKPTVIANAEGSRTTPSIVGFSKTGEKLVGQLAKRQAILNPDKTIASIKRQMGSDYKKEINGKEYTPQEISAMILRKLADDASAYLGEKVTSAVITVPAYFNDAQRQATKDAGKIAGLDVLRIVNEPTAAALAYGLEKDKPEKVLVFDLGGGTFDVSVLEIGDGVHEVLSTSGDTHLGGDDFDQKIIDWMADEFKKQEGIDLRGDKQAMQRLKEAAEKAKCELSSVVETTINLPFITADANGPKHLDLQLTRAKFEELSHDLLERCKKPVEQALQDAGLTKGDINEVVLVGGTEPHDVDLLVVVRSTVNPLPWTYRRFRDLRVRRSHTPTEPSLHPLRTRLPTPLASTEVTLFCSSTVKEGRVRVPPRLRSNVISLAAIFHTLMYLLSPPVMTKLSRAEMAQARILS